MINLKRVGTIIALGAMVVACGKGTDAVNPINEVGLIPAATEHTVETPAAPATEPAVQPEPAVITNPEPGETIAPAIAEVHAVTIGETLSSHLMNISREFKMEDSCIQVLGGLQANSSQFLFAKTACPASGAIQSANIAFLLKADIEALAATSEKEVSQNQIRKGFLTFKGMPMSEQVQGKEGQTQVKEEHGQVKEEQGQMKKAPPVAQAIEQRVGEFEIRSWTELLPVQGKPAVQEQNKGKVAEPVQQSTLHHEIVLTKLCTDEYAATCQVLFERGHFSSIQLLATEMAKVETALPAGEAKVEEKKQVEETKVEEMKPVVEQVKEQRPAQEVKVEEKKQIEETKVEEKQPVVEQVKEQRPAQEVKEQSPAPVQG